MSDLGKEFANPNAQPVLSLFSLEYRGYQTSAYAASALGMSSLTANSNGKDSVIWNGSWAELDKNITTFVVGLDKPGQKDPPHAATTPHNPWPN